MSTLPHSAAALNLAESEADPEKSQTEGKKGNLCPSIPKAAKGQFALSANSPLGNQEREYLLKDIWVEFKRCLDA